MNWKIDTYASPDELAPLLAEWETLAERVRPWHPFATPAWNTLWWKYYRKRGLLSRDEFFVHALRGDDGRLVAVVPLFRRYSPGIGPIALRAVEFFGADSSITEIRGAICEAADRPAVIEALREHLCRNQQWDVWKWCGVQGAPEVVASPVGATMLLGTETLSDYVITLPGTWKDLLAKVSSNMRKSVRKSYEFLERDGHSFRFRPVIGAGENGAALQAFLRLHAARAAVADMSFRHPDRFTNEINRAFIMDLAVEMARQRRLMIFELEIAGQVVASRLAFVCDRQLYLYYSGYDPSWRQYSIMTTLMAEILRWSIAERMTTVNLSTGSDLSKLRWQPEEIRFTSGRERRAGLRGYLLSQAYSTTAAARRTLFWMRGYRSGGMPEGGR